MSEFRSYFRKFSYLNFLEFPLSTTKEKKWQLHKSGNFQICEDACVAGREGGQESNTRWPMAPRGQGSWNRKRPLLIEAGEHERDAMGLLGKTVQALEAAKENIHPKKLPRLSKQLDTVSQQATSALQALAKTSSRWQAAAQVDFAVSQGARERDASSQLPDKVIERLDLFVSGHRSGATSSTSQEGTPPDAGTCMRGGRELRARTYTVGGYEISYPKNGAWYQTSEAVQILYDLQVAKARIGKQLVGMWRHHTPPWIQIGYPRLTKMVKRIATAVQNGSTPEQAIAENIRDRVSVDALPQNGRPPIMGRTDFLEQLKTKCRFEQAATQEDAAKILSCAKRELYAKRGLKASSDEVSVKTVKRHWQAVGGEELSVRTAVQERSHARVQASRSMMHMLAYFFTVFYTHM